MYKRDVTCSWPPPPVTNCYTFTDFLPPRASRTLWTTPRAYVKASTRFENWGAVGLKIQQMEVRSTWLRVSSPEFLFNYAQVIEKSPLWNVFSLNSAQIIEKSSLWNVFYLIMHKLLKSHLLGTCFPLISLYIIGYNISQPPTTPIPKSGVATPNSQDWRLRQWYYI